MRNELPILVTEVCTDFQTTHERWITKNDVETASSEDFGESQRPVEEAAFIGSLKHKTCTARVRKTTVD
jgi:hypothetical protein